MNIYIYYDKKTKIYKNTSDKPNRYKEYDFIKIKKSEWEEFINTYPEIIKIEAGKLKSEKRIRSLQELKDNAINSRKAYRKQKFLDWFDDLENMPQELKEKTKKVKKEIKEIEAITTKEELEQWQTTKD